MREISHLFVLDPLNQLHPHLDSSTRLMNALLLCGQKVFITVLGGLSWRSDKGCPQARVQEWLDPSPKLGPQLSIDLDDSLVIHMRKDPPFDMDYLSATWILSAAKGPVWNHPKALRDINEKLAILKWPKWSEGAFLGSDPQTLVEILRSKAWAKVVVKPLLGHGGKGVRALDLAGMNDQALRNWFNQETEGGRSQRLIQNFNDAIYSGEIRAFYAFGQPLSFCLKKPKKGEFLANTAAGATLEPFEPSQKLLDTLSEASQSLLKEGVFFVGYDVIGNAISEMNITSPRVLVAPDQDSSALYTQWAKACIEHAC